MGRRFDGVSFLLQRGETLMVLGPSGAGKSSLLRAIAGLEQPDRGCVCIDGRDVTRTAPQARRIAFVSQDDALFPHMTIFRNLAFPLRMRGAPREEIATRVRAIAERLEIRDHLQRLPRELSGGERQRAALGRAILRDPRVLLLDEPLAHLDPQLRARMRTMFSRPAAGFAGTAVHVTHDHAEALSAGDRLAIMIDGRIVQTGEPRAVYERPASIAAARFFGAPPMNLLDGQMEITGIRPERMRIDPQAPLRGTVLRSESTGADTFVTFVTPRGQAIVRANANDALPQPGEETGIAFSEADACRFDRSTGILIA